MAKIKKTDDTKCCRARGGISTLTYCSQGHTTMPQNSLTEQISDFKKKKNNLYPRYLFFNSCSTTVRRQTTQKKWVDLNTCFTKEGIQMPIST